MMDLFQRNYEAVVNRGLINDKTTDNDFFKKLVEEGQEIKYAWSDDNLNEEIADLLTVCSNWLMHRGVNLREILTKTAEKNEKRASENTRN